MTETEKQILKILIVDDDVSLSLFLKKILTTDGYSATVATNTAIAKELLQKDRYNILFVDLVLPGADGSDIIKIVKKDFPETFCVLISGYYNESFENYKVLVGADVVVGKPITKETLADIVKQYFAKYPAA